jgi:hypothetical protein
MGPGSRFACPGRQREVSDSNCHTARGCASAFSRRAAPEPCFGFHPQETRGRRESRVRAAPAVSRAIVIGKKRTRAYRFSGSSPAFPAQWFYGLFRDLPGETSSIATVASQIISAKLGASVGRPNHATSPSARVTIVSRNSCVHRIPPLVRDDSRSAPLIG